MKMAKTRIALLLLFSTSLSAQEKMASRPDAVQSIDGVLSEVLRILNGERGKTRNWDDFRNLFLPSSRLAILNQGDDFPAPVESVSVEEFIDYMHDDYYDQGFRETELEKHVDEYKGIAQVFQTTRIVDGDGEDVKGISSYQLVHCDGRWWIANVLWTIDSHDVEVSD